MVRMASEVVEHSMESRFDVLASVRALVSRCYK